MFIKRRLSLKARVREYSSNRGGYLVVESIVILRYNQRIGILSIGGAYTLGFNSKYT